MLIMDFIDYIEKHFLPKFTKTFMNSTQQKTLTAEIVLNSRHLQIEERLLTTVTVFDCYLVDELSHTRKTATIDTVFLRIKASITMA